MRERSRSGRGEGALRTKRASGVKETSYSTKERVQTHFEVRRESPGPASFHEVVHRVLAGDGRCSFEATRRALLFHGALVS